MNSEAYNEGFNDGFTSELPAPPEEGRDDYMKGYAEGSEQRDDDRKFDDKPERHVFEKSGLGAAPFRCTAYDYSKRGATCDHCGTPILHLFDITSADGKVSIVGSTCVGKTGDAGLIDEAKQLRKQAERAAKAAKRQAEFDARRDARIIEAYAADPEGVMTLLCYTGDNRFVNDMVRQIETWGSLTENQMKAVPTAIERDKQKVIDDATAEPVPDTEERIKISGVILSINYKEGYMGAPDRRVATIRDERGFKVWGTMNEGGRGDRIEFMARVEPSDKDPKFGFYKRPTKIVVTEADVA